MKLMLIFTILQITYLTKLTENGTFLIDWELSTQSCSQVITNRFKITNANFYYYDKIQISDVCTTRGQLIAIRDCHLIRNNQIEVLSYFFSLPENDKKKQCYCQAKCIGIQVSYYTLKFFYNTTAFYYTTSNPCVAYCNRGYEIYLSSFLLNSYPSDPISFVSKIDNNECYNSLNEQYSRGIQLELIKLQLCKAHIVCGILIDQFMSDIIAVEKAIYGEVKKYDYVTTNSDRFWNKPVNPDAIRCTELLYANEVAVCINQYGTSVNKICFYETTGITVNNQDRHTFTYAGVISQVYDCVRGYSSLIGRKDYALDTLQCICEYYYGGIQFNTDELENIYHNYNERYTTYSSTNFYFEFVDVYIGYPKMNYVLNSCECKQLDYIYDYLCSSAMYAVCIINDSHAKALLFSSNDERSDYIWEIIKDPPDMIVGYLEHECNMLNSICLNNKDHTARCVFKMFNGFTYPIIKADNSFMLCVDQYNIDKGNDKLNYYFDCPENKPCTSTACSINLFENCKTSTYFSSNVEDFCAKYNFECAGACASDEKKLCVKQLYTDYVFLISSYDLCVRRCSGTFYNVLCGIEPLSNCLIEDCTRLICDDCKKNALDRCDDQCWTNIEDRYNYCKSTLCINLNDDLLTTCKFTNNISVVPYKISAHQNCIEECMNNSVSVFVSCPNCSQTPESCCSYFCLQKDNTSLQYCFEVENVFKNITLQERCLYECTGKQIVEKSYIDCNVCASACDLLPNDTNRFCTFDTLILKYCMTHKQLCVESCENSLCIAIDCYELDDYQCFLSYCEQCYTKRTLNKAINCPIDCYCKDANISTFNGCKFYLTICFKIKEDDAPVCVLTNNSYALISSYDICIQHSDSNAVSDILYCQTCKINTDCCMHSCVLSAQKNCNMDNSSYFYPTVKEVCNQLCNSISSYVVDDINCCYQKCNLLPKVVCVKQGKIFLVQDRSKYCEHICNEGFYQVEVVDSSACCFYNCMNEENLPQCIYRGTHYTTISHEEVCREKCLTRNTLQLRSKYECCVSDCYAQEIQHAKGSYCDDLFNIYKSWVDYCITQICNDAERNVIFCSDMQTCSSEMCRAKFADSKCGIGEQNAAVLIDQRGRCKIYKSLCIARIFKSLSDYIFECTSPAATSCINNSNLVSIYSNIKSDYSDTTYCKNKTLLSAAQYNLNKRCLESEVLDTYECNGRICDDSFCAQKYCYEICTPTTSFYWGYDCNYYKSSCEAECLGIKYFDFLDIDQLESICKQNPTLIENYKELIMLKKYVCSNTGNLQIIEIYENERQPYADCLTLESTDFADCRNKCKKWVKLNYFYFKYL